MRILNIKGNASFKKDFPHKVKYSETDRKGTMFLFRCNLEGWMSHLQSNKNILIQFIYGWFCYYFFIIFKGVYIHTHTDTKKYN